MPRQNSTLTVWLWLIMFLVVGVAASTFVGPYKGWMDGTMVADKGDADKKPPKTADKGGKAES